jgi:serine/threonine protein kinase
VTPGASGYEVLSKLESSINDFLCMEGYNSDYLAKNVLISEVNNLFIEGQNKPIEKIAVNALLILSKYSYKIDYYNIYLYHMFASYKKKIMEFYEAENTYDSKQSDLLAWINSLISIEFNLRERYLNELGGSGETIQLYAYIMFLFRNFPYMFLKPEESNSDYHHSEKDRPHKRCLGYPNRMVVKGVEDVPNLLNYLNSKLIRWKSLFFDSGLRDKCRICETEVDLKELGFHSLFCSNKAFWKETFKQTNEEIKSYINQIINLSLINIDNIEFEFTIPSIKKSLEVYADNEDTPMSNKLLLTLKNICQLQSQVVLSNKLEINKKEFNNINSLLHNLLILQNKLLNDKAKDVYILVERLISSLLKKYSCYLSYFNITCHCNMKSNGLNVSSAYISKEQLLKVGSLSLHSSPSLVARKQKTIGFKSSKTFNDSDSCTSRTPRIRALKNRSTTSLPSQNCKILKDKLFLQASVNDNSSNRSNYESNSIDSIEPIELSCEFTEHKESYDDTIKKSKFFEPSKQDSDLSIDVSECLTCKRVTYMCECQNGIIKRSLFNVDNDSVVAYSSEDEDTLDDIDMINKLNDILLRSEKVKEDIEIEAKQVSINDFEIIDVISEGGYGLVYLAKKKTTNDSYAIKKINKLYLKKKNLYNFIENEKAILTNLNNDYVVKCYYTFSDRTSIYFVMEYLNGGDMSYMLSKFKGINEMYVKQYSAEILLALEYLHKNEIIHRDLKPQNIMFDARGHVKLTDFGLSEFNMKDNKRSKCARTARRLSKTVLSKVYGTENYLAPELIMGDKHDKSVDYWAFGVIIYELLFGDPPFLADTTDKVFNSILERKLHWPLNISQEAYDIISALLQVNPVDRLGYKSIAEIKEMPFFKDIDWINIKKERFLFVPKSDSKEIPLYFEKKRVSFKTQDHPDYEGDDGGEESFQRDDLLHKRNLMHYSEMFRKIKMYDFGQLIGINSMINDMNIGEDL